MSERNSNSSSSSGLASSYLGNYQLADNFGALDNNGDFTYGSPVSKSSYDTSRSGEGWFNGTGGWTFGNVMGGLQDIGKLLSTGISAYTGLKGLGLARDQLGLAKQDFSFQKGLANRNLANQATTINNMYAIQAAVDAARDGGTDAEVDARKAQYMQNAKALNVDGSPIVV